MSERRKEILFLAADKAMLLPIKESGFWFHADLRDNVYYATHVLAALFEGWKPSNEVNARELAERVFLDALRLQDRNPESSMYGHWPLNLGEDPKKAAPHGLPVELMGCLLTYFYTFYKEALSDSLQEELYQSLKNVYKSGLYMQGISQYNHHESKHTSLKLLMGHLFGENGYIEEGIKQTRELLRNARVNGFKEYGSLPWHWHWIQAFTCVHEVVENDEVKQVTGEMLNYLWNERTLYYLKGTWVGPHSRVLPHDIPRDANSLLDYVQFGDFPLPSNIHRLEGAGLLHYEVSREIRNLAVDRTGPVELKKKIVLRRGDNAEVQEQHKYVYLTPSFALGGIWEYAEEYLNEQQRWEVTLPLTSIKAGGSNQAFFFHPGKHYKEGDPRHSTGSSEVLFHRNVVAALYQLPDESYDSIVGNLPVGEWSFKERNAYGKIGDVYLYVHVMKDCEWTKHTDRVLARSTAPFNGVLMEALNRDEVGVDSLAEFIERVQSRKVGWFRPPGVGVGLEYRTWSGELIRFAVSLAGIERSVNGREIGFEGYEV